VFASLALAGGNLLSRVAWPLNDMNRELFAGLLVFRMLEVADAEDAYQAAGHG
jgi:hypothetical protein